MPSRAEIFRSMLNDPEKLSRMFSESEPLFDGLGMKIVEVSSGAATTEIPKRKDFLRSGGILQGGIMMAAMDYTGGIAAMTVNTGLDQVTQEVKVNFLEPMKEGPFRSAAKVVRAGRTAVVISIEFRDAGGRLGATALGTWYVLHKTAVG